MRAMVSWHGRVSLGLACIYLVLHTGCSNDECWKDGFTRGYCCHSSPGMECFDEVHTAKTCCTPVEVVTGPESYELYLGFGSQFMKPFLFMLNRKVIDRGRHAAPAAAAHVFAHLRMAKDKLLALNNVSFAAPGSLPEIGEAYVLTIAYFVAYEAAMPHLTENAHRRLQRREKSLWSLFASLYRQSFGGHTDFCRCMEGGEFYSHINAHMRESGFGQRSFVRTMFNSSTTEHAILRAQGCGAAQLESLLPENALSLMFSTGCVSGDVAMALLLLQSCLLEFSVEKALLLHDTIFRLATLAFDCHDADFWRFTMRDTAVHYAKAIWTLARLPSGGHVVDIPFLRRLAWDPRRKPSVPDDPWWWRCGPHEIEGPVRVSARDDTSSDWVPGEQVVGPLCTEIGRFWLRLETIPVTHSFDTVLVVLAITYLWWANPWHHLHWWIPALFHLRLRLGLEPDNTDVALTFPTTHADWGKAVGTKLTKPERSEPPSWSYLQGDWQPDPHSKRTDIAPWQRNGLHEQLLGWLSTRTAAPLRYFEGRNYGRVVIGLPPMRFTLQSPFMTCAKIAAVKRLVATMPAFLSLAEANTAGEHSHGRTKKRLAIIQRSQKEGRSVENLDAVLEALNKHFGEVVEVHIIRKLGAGQPWTNQFKTFADTDLLMAVGGGALGWIWAMPEGSAVIEMRAKNSPVWLPCSERWDLDRKEMFGGLAYLSGVHHICVRPHIVGRWQDQGLKADLSDPEDLREYDRLAPVYVHPERAVELVRQALHLLRSEPPPCK